MKTVALSIFSVLVSANFLFAAQPEHRFVQLFQFPATLESIVVAEGDLEPRSVGSYAVRVYEARSQKFPTDRFIAGIVRPRNGIIEAVRLDDIDGDNRPEIIVIMRAAARVGIFPRTVFATVTGYSSGSDPLRISTKQRIRFWRCAKN